MIDQLFHRNYESRRAELNRGIDSLFARVANGAAQAFEVLNAIQFDAPWKHRRRRTKRA